jgi:hypothetical protein
MAQVSKKQIDFFDNLLAEKQFPPGETVEQLRAKFATLNKSSASDWINRAIALPDLGEETEESVPAPF